MTINIFIISILVSLVISVVVALYYLFVSICHTSVQLSIEEKDKIKKQMHNISLDDGRSSLIQSVYDTELPDPSFNCVLGNNDNTANEDFRSSDFVVCYIDKGDTAFIRLCYKKSKKIFMHSEDYTNKKFALKKAKILAEELNTNLIKV